MASSGGSVIGEKKRCSHGLPLDQAAGRYEQLERLAKDCNYTTAGEQAGEEATEEDVVDAYMELHRSLFQRRPDIVDPQVADACFAMAAETLRNPEPRPVEARQWRLKALAIDFYKRHGEDFFSALTAPHSTSIYEEWRHLINVPDEFVKRVIRDKCTCSCLGCHVCGASPSNNRCGTCKRRYYCSRECQKEDWNAMGHKHSCTLSA